MLSTIRHDEIFAREFRDYPVTVVGAGAIGSRIAASLIELGMSNITVYDYDTVEAHNLSNQLYGSLDVGEYKVRALTDWVAWKLGAEMQSFNAIPERVDENTELNGSVFLVVDSMEQREQIFRNCIEGNLQVPRVIDVRMAATHGNVFCFNPHSQGQLWLDTLIDDDMAEVSSCGTSLTVGATASILANLAVWQFMHALSNPAAQDDRIDLYLQPLCIHTAKLKEVPDVAA